MAFDPDLICRAAGCQTTAGCLCYRKAQMTDATHGMNDDFVDALLDRVVKLQKLGVSNADVLQALEGMGELQKKGKGHG